MDDHKLFAPSFLQKDVQILEKKRVFKSYFAVDHYRVSYPQFDGGSSGVLEREIFERDQDAVVILPYDPGRDEIMLLEQFRPGALRDPVSPWLLEVVAGMVDAGETPEQAALRELQEEGHLRVAPGDLHYLYREYPSPGGTSERVTIYIAACDLHAISHHGGLPQEHEDLRLFTCTAAQAFAQVETGRICNAAAIIALLWLKLHHARCRQGDFSV